jgi:TPR repeat protein
VYFQGALIVFTVWLAYYAYFYFENLHFHITHVYAHLGMAEAQHQVGHRYLVGRGVEKHKDHAMHWFK